MRKKYSQAALKKSAEGTSGLFSFFESKKRGRADEGQGLLGFLQDSAFVDVVKVQDLDEEEPLNWTLTVFSTSRVSAPDTSVEAHTSFVAELPRRPGHVAVRSGSSKGKGDLVMVIEKTLYNEAVDLYQGPYGREAKDRIESDPYEGVLPDRNGAPSFQYASEDDAISAILETKQPYGDGLHKFLALSSFFRWQTPAKQRKMDAEMKATFTEGEILQYSSLFIDETGNTLPKIGVRVAHDNERGTNVDYRARRFESDPKGLLTFDRGTIGGAQNGARKLLAIDSEEDMRLKTPEVAATTMEEKTMFVRLNDAAVLAARSETLFKKGSWLNKNVVGLAWVQGRGLSLVRTKEGTTRYKNLKKHDRNGANQMEVGRSGDFSTPSAKGKVNGPRSNFGMTKNATVEGARAREVAAEAAVEAAHTAEEQTAAQRHLVVAIKRRKLVVKARQDQATGDGVGLPEKLRQLFAVEDGHGNGPITSGGCNTPKFEEAGVTKMDRVSWQLDEDDRLILPPNNTNNPGGKHPVCQIGGTVPVEKVNGSWRLCSWALPYVSTGRVVQRLNQPGSLTGPKVVRVQPAHACGAPRSDSDAK
eukprot:g8531.t1